MFELPKRCSEGWNVDKEVDLSSKFPLHKACRDGEVKVLTSLLHQLETNVENSDLLLAEDLFYNWTPAHFAAYFGRGECLRLLCQAAAVFNPARAERGLPPLPCPSSVASARYRQTPLHVLAFADHPRAMQWLLAQSGIDLEAKDYLGESALHKACRTGSRECIQLLCACKADMRARNFSELTPPQLAAACQHRQIADDMMAALTGVQPRSDDHGCYTSNIAAHGLNAGVFPAATSPATTATSATAAATPATPPAAVVTTGTSVVSAAADATPSAASSGVAIQTANGKAISGFTNGFTNGVFPSGFTNNSTSNGFNNGTSNGFNNGTSNGFNNGTTSGEVTQSQLTANSAKRLGSNESAAVATTSTSTSGFHISSSCYYGGYQVQLQAQPQTQQLNTADMDMEMEEPQRNGDSTSNIGMEESHRNGANDSTRTNNSTAIGNSTPAIGPQQELMSTDLLLNEGVSRNVIAVAGRKRSREDEESPMTKRGRYEEPQDLCGGPAPVAPVLLPRRRVTSRPHGSNTSSVTMMGTSDGANLFNGVASLTNGSSMKNVVNLFNGAAIVNGVVLTNGTKLINETNFFNKDSVVNVNNEVGFSKFTNASNIENGSLMLNGNSMSSGSNISNGSNILNESNMTNGAHMTNGTKLTRPTAIHDISDTPSSYRETFEMFHGC